jgi:hypothetical protein
MIFYKRQGLVIRKYAQGDADKIKDKIRKVEIDEIYAASHFNSGMALAYSIGISKFIYTMEYHGEIIGILGVATNNSVWMLTTDAIDKARMRFLRASKFVIGMILEQYPQVYNYVDVRHEKCLKWLRWCGAIIHEPEEYGMEKLPFCRIELGRAV